MYTLHVSLLQFLILFCFIDDIYTISFMTKTSEPSSKSEDNSLKPEHITQFHNTQYFQDIFSEHSSPFEIMFGHVSENPEEWEQRYERRNMNEGKYQGKVLWGNQNGNYGEHYWDLNHR